MDRDASSKSLMTRQPPKTVLLWACLVAVAGGGLWWGVRRLDATSSAIFVSDSPDGKYRCGVFQVGGSLAGLLGSPEYEAGLFQGNWPHRELPGGRAEWNHDSVSSSDFRPTWQSDGVDIDFRTGCGEGRGTVRGRDRGGTQEWH